MATDYWELSGRVYYGPDLIPIENCLISFDGREFRTGATNRFSLEGEVGQLGKGPLLVRKEGYADYSKSFNLVPGDDEAIDEIKLAVGISSIISIPDIPPEPGTEQELVFSHNVAIPSIAKPIARTLAEKACSLNGWRLVEIDFSIPTETRIVVVEEGSLVIAILAIILAGVLAVVLGNAFISYRISKTNITREITDQELVKAITDGQVPDEIKDDLIRVLEERRKETGNTGSIWGSLGGAGGLGDLALPLAVVAVVLAVTNK